MFHLQCGDGAKTAAPPIRVERLLRERLQPVKHTNPYFAGIFGMWYYNTTITLNHSAIASAFDHTLAHVLNLTNANPINHTRRMLNKKFCVDGIVFV